MPHNPHTTQTHGAHVGASPTHATPKQPEVTTAINAKTWSVTRAGWPRASTSIICGQTQLFPGAYQLGFVHPQD